MQEMSDKAGAEVAAVGTGGGARAGAPTVAEQAAASPLLRALVARYLMPGDPVRLIPPGAPPEG
jgi:hypothetical protein